MTDITKLVKRLRGYNWEYADVIAAADALEAQAKEMAEFSDTASKHVSFWVQIKHEQDARIAELEALVEDAYREGWSDGHCSDGSNRNVRDEDWKGSMANAALNGENG